MYRVRDGKISQIVKSDPQWPQSFYPLPSSVKIEKGDYVVGQCVYDNNDDRVITAGWDYFLFKTVYSELKY